MKAHPDAIPLRMFAVGCVLSLSAWALAQPPDSLVPFVPEHARLMPAHAQLVVPPQLPDSVRGDCNGNGIPDECDLDCGDPGGPCDVPGCGQSADCQPDGIPDDCQLYGFEHVYRYDDGTAEYGLRSDGTHLAWLNRFIVIGDAVVIDAVDLTYVNVVEGAPAMVYLWSDPDGDGDPADAQVLASTPTTTVNNPGGVFRVDLPNTYVGERGTSFFVGTMLAYPDDGAFPCPLDATAPTTLGVSWIIGSDAPIDPNDLSAGAIEYNLVEDAIGIPMNVVVRAVGLVPSGDCNLNDIPDDCDISDGTSADLDGDGVPDECEDCNGNGVPDDWDVDPTDPDGDGHVSADCQPDGIPDECQLEGNDCNSDGIPDDCQLVGNDCNHNGVPDECDIAAGTSLDLNGDGVPDECEDCNGNGVPDEWDVDPTDPDGDGWVSPDCQPDGVPDECQWGTPDYGTYVLDDGSLEATLGLGAPGETAWLNHFTVEAGLETVTYIDLVYANSLGEGMPVTIYLWSDPDGDGSPADARVITSTVAAVANPGLDVFNPVYIGDTYIGEAGTSFFVGALLRDETGGAYPITRDTDDVQGESWFAAQRLPGTLNPNDLGAAEFFGQLLGGWDGNCLVRARGFSGVYPNDCNSNGVPDECDIADGTVEDVDGNGVPDECEDCNENGIPDGCDVSCDGACATVPGCGQSEDCNGNGVPDECDVFSGLDCNGNGIPDECDVPPLGDFSLDCNEDLMPDECQLEGNDCNGNGIPDDCELGGPPIPQYVLDDGLSENDIGLSTGGTLAWLNHFVTQPNGESIRGIRIAYGDVAPETPVTLCVWSDPDGDGSPRDAQVLASTSTAVANPGSDAFVYIEFTDVYVGEAGTSFFVGAIIRHASGEFPAALDQSSDQRGSWLAGGSGSVDPGNLSAAALFGRCGDFGFAGNWLVRAVPAAVAPPNDCNSNGVPDECDLADGTSEDCNSNGVPDECDVPPLGDFSLDCNGNLIPDECEVAAGNDCDGDGVPDDCQPEDDCDDNGLLDVCEVDYTEGLVGQYWRSIGGAGNFSRRLAVRVDPTIDFDWGDTAPHPDVPADNFAIRWTGLLHTPSISGTYWFITKADDGVRLWINGELLIDEWHSSSGDEYFAEVTLLGDTAYHIRLEYYDGGGGARVYLKWAVPGGMPEIVPASVLQPMRDCNGNGVPDACDIDGGGSQDLNANGVPDECEDCNDNGVLDAYDILDGTSEDCNANGLPDECELELGAFADCDGNGVLDECEEFQDCDGNGIFDACQAITDGLVGAYYIGEGYGTYVASRIDPFVDFDFDADPPFMGFPDDHFSVRWTGAVVTTDVAGAYTFDVLHDDGVRLWLQGDLIIDRWDGTGHDSVTVELDADTAYVFRLDYRQGVGEAYVRLGWQVPGGTLEVIPQEALRPMYDRDGSGVPDVCEFGDCNGNGVPDPDDIADGRSTDCDENGVPDECQPEDDCDGNHVLDQCEDPGAAGLTGQYWRSLGGDGRFSELVFVRVDPQVNFNWGDGGPVDGLRDQFTIRWTGTVTTTASGGTYTFYTHTDDGVRLWVDDRLLIDEWHTQSPTEWSGSITLEPDRRYLIRMDYFESGGGAEAALKWQPPGGVKVVIPSAQLGAMSDVDGSGIPDDCDTDCNGNGISDALDLANCDGSPWCDDCNGNGILDECDLIPPEDTTIAYWRFEELTDPVLDSGPDGLDGSSTSAERVADIPVDPVPQTELPNTQSLYLGGDGFVTVPDAGGLLTIGNASFTVEAWVKLDRLGTTASSDQRQWLCMKKPYPSQDTAIDYAVLAQAGDFGSTGRELVLRFSDGPNVVSTLEIQNLDWNYVSVAFDAEADTVRFGVNDRFETIAFTDGAHPTNTGPLTVGAHFSGVGTYNQFLRGAVDELRISAGIVPRERLLSAPYEPPSQDTDGDGIPDECECPGDLDGDGDIDLADLAQLLAHYGTASGAVYEDGDLDGDGDVDLSDLAALLAVYGTSCE